MYLKSSIFITILGLFLASIGVIAAAEYSHTQSTVAASHTPAGKIDLTPLVSADIISVETDSLTVPNNDSSTESTQVESASEQSDQHQEAKPNVVKTANAEKPIVTSLPKKSASLSAPPATCSGSFVNEFLCLLNNYRISKGKGKLNGSSSLSSVALTHSKWMETNDIFSHTGVNGSRLGDRCSAAGVKCRAENLALHASSPQNLLGMWVASPSHRDNLLGSYTTVGIGISGEYITLLLN